MPYKDPKNRKLEWKRWIANPINKEKKKDYMKEYHQINSEKLNETARRWRESHREAQSLYNKKRNLEYRIGITLEEFETTWQKQNGLCALCGRILKRTPHGYASDHNHKTGRFRGILCQLCNTRLHLFEDEKLKTKIESYLASSSSSSEQVSSIATQSRNVIVPSASFL